MDEFNPYSTPAAQDPSMDPDTARGLWRVSDGRLLFRDGAKLPMVDLHTGRADVPLTPASTEFRAGSAAALGLIRWGWAVLILPLVFFSDMGLGNHLPLVIFAVVFGWSMVGRLLVARRFRRARLHWHVASEGERARRLRVKWVSRFFWAAFVFLMTCLFAGWHEWTSLAFLVFAGGIVAMAALQRGSLQLRCAGVKGDWFEIRGIPLPAMQVLGGLQYDAMREWEQGARATRMRKVYAVHVHRFSIRAILGGQVRSPILCLVVLIMKLTRSRLLKRDAFASSEARDIKSGEWDPALRKRWDEIQTVEALHGWRLLHARELDSPMGDVRTQGFALTSPADDQCLAIGLVQVANARASKEVEEISFRTWADDGTVWLTTNVFVQPPVPPQVRAKQVKGGLKQVMAAHQRRIAGLRPVAVSGPGEWERRLVADDAERHAMYEAAGLFGPMREEEFPVAG